MLTRRRAALLAAATLSVFVSVPSAWATRAPFSPHGTRGAPTIERIQHTDVFAPDQFFQDLCGITTNTTAKERVIIKTWPDGSQSLHVARSFIPDDPRLPIERGAGTAYFAPEGTQTRITGTPIHLIGPDGGTRALDAGLLIIGDPNISHGHVDVGTDNPDLAPFYCPSD